VSRSGIEQYLYMMDRAFDAPDGWHSLLKNIAAVKDGDWDWVAEGGKRSIRAIAIHCGAIYMWENHVFGDGSMRWESIPWPENWRVPSILDWLRTGVAKFRAGIDALGDDEELARPRPAPQGMQMETRWCISIMIQHLLYHSGEINYIRALRQGNDE
jgi:hypothetical protein